MTFHSIDGSGSLLSFEASELTDLLEAARTRDLPILSLDRLLDPACSSGLALTFDDGMKSVRDAALPILKRFAAPAHVFLTTGHVGGRNDWPSQPAGAPGFDMLGWDDVGHLHAAGLVIGAHTRSHPDLRTLSEAEIEDECGAADDEITRRLGAPPRHFAYPYGGCDRRVRRCVSSRYRACLTTELRRLGTGDRPDALPRLDSYYLRRSWLRRHFDAPPAAAYLAFRRGLRQLRAAGP